ncbi:MAG: YabP/YqfC family sporulation protein [Clostridia bacterium]|nr:YabP/YqfC family sporulation protein [Clostridia bacterium]MBR0407641.1 YabP/YqfC family sporulation protein [Clostridia bacterium]
MEKEIGQNRSGAVKSHLLTLDNRRRAALTGVSEVLGFDENQVSLMTENGEVTLTGEGLHVTKLTLEDGQLAVEGKIDGIQYAAQRSRRRSLFRRGEA